MLRCAEMKPLAAILLLMAGCGGGDAGGGGGAGSCVAAFNRPDGGAVEPDLCLEVMGGTAQDQATSRAQCQAQGNTWVMEPCPHAKAVGGCRTTRAAVAITTWYYAPGSTRDEIKSLCEGLASVAPAGLTIQFVLP